MLGVGKPTTGTKAATIGPEEVLSLATLSPADDSHEQNIPSVRTTI
jgi:hypothetical protein